MTNTPELSGIARAVKQAGGQLALARLISTPDRQIRQGHIWSWLNNRPITPGLCPAIEVATQVPCEDLRPDLRWDRDSDGRVIAYSVPLQPIETGKAAALAAAEGEAVGRAV